jgi:hypothetical protein
VSVEENNKALVRRFHEEAWNKGNVATVDEFMAADYVDYPIPSGLPPGTEGLKQTITTYRTAFPDLKATIDCHLRRRRQSGIPLEHARHPPG